jgi:hypothetical protein
MPLFLLAVPALVAQTPAAPAALDLLQDQFKAIPLTLVEGKASSVKAQVLKAKAAWEKARPDLGKVIPAPETAFIDKQLKAMLKMKPREQAMGAIGISATFSRFQGKSRKQDLLQAQRSTLSGWCGVDAGLWEPFPGVAETFKPLLDQDNGAHPVAVIGIQDALKRLAESRAKRQAPAAKKALKDLASLAEVLAQP